MWWIEKAFASLPDPRTGNTKRHDLLEVLTIALTAAVGEGVVAIDGKTLRRSFDDAAHSNPLAVVTAFASSSRLVIGQESFRAAAGDSEILAARALLRCLDLEGRLVTADALHCQTQTAQLIRERGGDYLLRLESEPSRPARDGGELLRHAGGPRGPGHGGDDRWRSRADRDPTRLGQP
jgi:hypothetical protein